MAEAVKVCLRVRPLSQKELDKGCKNVCTVESKLGQIAIANPEKPQAPPRTFTFDAVFDWNSAQRDIYDMTAKGIVESCFDGYNGTIFAYGQTGAGKSFTMAGKREPEELRGIIPNAFDHIFSLIKEAGDTKQFLVRSSYLEIYNEEIRDLLGKDPTKRLDLKEHVETGVYVKDLTSFICKSVSEIEHVMKVGSKNRAVGATNMNEQSSRSHSIFTIIIETSEKGADGENHIRVGKLNLVDLAGSERASKTGATGDRLVEGAKINLSLSALSNVISALVDGKSTHVPYRDSKLTRLLQDSLGGNTKTVMIANLGPADYNFDESVSTLGYANRAKNIKNKPKINEDPKDAMLREFQQEIERLKKLLEERSQGRGGALDPSGDYAAVGAGNGVAAGGQPLLVPSAPSAVVGLSDEQLEQLKKENEDEKRRIMEAKKMTEEEKQQIASELERRNAELERERQEREALAGKLRAMQETVMHGENLLEVAKQQETELIKQRTELEERRAAEEQARKELQEKEEALLVAEEKYASLEEEIDGKTKKLKKLMRKYQQSREEIADLNHEFQQEREDMLDTIREYEKQLKLKMLIIENFIPPEEMAKIERRAEWNEDRGEWAVRKLQFAGNNMAVKRPGSAVGARRPTSEYARVASHVDGSNPRFRGDNILSLDLDMPDRTTVDGAAAAATAAAAASTSTSSSSSSSGGNGGGGSYDNMLSLSDVAPNVYFSYASSPSAGQGEDMLSSGRRPGSRASGSAAAAAAASVGSGSGSAMAGAARPGSAVGKRPTSSRPPRKIPKPSQSEEFPEERGLVSSQERIV